MRNNEMEKKITDSLMFQQMQAGGDFCYQAVKEK